MSLSKNGKADDFIAVITDNKDHKKGFISYDRNNTDNLNFEIDDITDEILEYYYGKTLTRTKKNKYKLKEKLLNDVEEMTNEQKRHLKEIKAENDRKFYPLPLTNLYGERDAWYITGQAGSGKSRFCFKLVNYYHKLGINNIFVISSKDGDKETYKKFGVKDYLDINDLVNNSSNDDYYQQLETYKQKKIKLKYFKKFYKPSPEELMEKEIKIEMLKPDSRTKATNKENFILTKHYRELTKGKSVFIFDDFETLKNEDLNKCQWLINYILINERSRGVNIIVINHKNTNGLKGSHVLNESQKFVIFQRNLYKNYHYLLHHYLGLDNKEINKIKSVLKKSNYCCIDRLNRVIFSEHLIYLF